MDNDIIKKMDFDIKDPIMFKEDDIEFIFEYANYLLLNNDSDDNLNKPLKIIRNSICFKKFPYNRFRDLLNFIVSFNKNKNQYSKLISFQIIHNFLCASETFENFEDLLWEILEISISSLSDQSCNSELKSTICLLLFCFSTTVFNIDSICVLLTKPCILNILEDNEDANILFCELLGKSQTFISHCFNNLDLSSLVELLKVCESCDEDLTEGNINFLSSYLLEELAKEEHPFKNLSENEINVVREIFVVLTNQKSLKEKLSLDKQLILTQSCIEILKCLRKYDEDLNENVKFKSHYSVSREETIDKRPIYNIKKLVTMMISTFAYQNNHIQDLIVEQCGLEEVMSNTRIDLCNPFIQEHAIFALKNICTGNERACERVMSMTKTESVSDEMLKILNYTKVVRDGSVMYVPKK